MVVFVTCKNDEMMIRSKMKVLEWPHDYVDVSDVQGQITP